jgi:hypothetical protein
MVGCQANAKLEVRHSVRFAKQDPSVGSHENRRAEGRLLSAGAKIPMHASDGITVAIRWR